MNKLKNQMVFYKLDMMKFINGTQVSHECSFEVSINAIDLVGNMEHKWTIAEEEKKYTTRDTQTHRKDYKTLHKTENKHTHTKKYGQWSSHKNFLFTL